MMPLQSKGGYDSSSGSLKKRYLVSVVHEVVRDPCMAMSPV